MLLKDKITTDKVSKCSRCGVMIRWEKTVNDKWIPMDMCGSCHFDTCPFAAEFRGKSNNPNYSPKGEIPKDQTTLE